MWRLVDCSADVGVVSLMTEKDRSAHPVMHERTDRLAEPASAHAGHGQRHEREANG
jgi:hypothetical protein